MRKPRRRQKPRDGVMQAVEQTAGLRQLVEKSALQNSIAEQPCETQWESEPKSATRFGGDRLRRSSQLTSLSGSVVLP